MKKTKPNHMRSDEMRDVAQQVVSSLKNTGHEMIALSERISLDDGSVLAKFERELVRMSMVPMLRECTDLLIAGFLGENDHEVSEEFRRLDTLIGLSKRL